MKAFDFILILAIVAGAASFFHSSEVSAPIDNFTIITRVRPDPVGGVVLPTNTLAIIAPYLALAGIVIAIAAVVVVKRRRD